MTQQKTHYFLRRLKVSPCPSIHSCARFLTDRTGLVNLVRLVTSQGKNLAGIIIKERDNNY